MFYVDTHCHLDLIKNIHLDPSIEDSLPVKSITVTNAPYLFSHNCDLFPNASNIRVALGMHPELVSQYSQQLDIFESNIGFTKYIGEIGLDGSPNHKSSYLLQKKVFEEILSIVLKADNKILTIHSRGASSETISLLVRHLANSSCKVILHWYSGNMPELKEAVKYNFYFSINHKMTGTKKGREIIEQIPMRLLLTETDAPFTLDHKIATRMDSIKESIKQIASFKKVNEEIVHETIYSNFKSLLT